MVEKSSLSKIFENWIKKGGDLSDMTDSISEQEIKSKEDAKIICDALKHLSTLTIDKKQKSICSPLHTLTSFFQMVDSKEAYTVFCQDGLPHLRWFVNSFLKGSKGEVNDIMFILKILAIFQQKEDVDLIAKVARISSCEGEYLWSVIFEVFMGEHPYAEKMINALRDPLPKNFILVAYLDLANSLAIANKLKKHPFNTPLGLKQIGTWLKSKNSDQFSYAKSATACLPFIDKASQKDLLAIANKHPDFEVRMESYWVQAKSGNQDAIDYLSKLCLDPCFSYLAQKYLEDLKLTKKIPKATKEPEFQALVEMSEWLSHPSEFGRPPSKIELFDSRNLFWPPTNDKRMLYLIKYTYEDTENKKPDIGIGMVGSITFALIGETNIDMSPEDIYAIHCCWELESFEDSRAPKKRSIKAGRKFLGKLNQGF